MISPVIGHIRVAKIEPFEISEISEMSEPFVGNSVGSNTEGLESRTSF